MYDPYIDQITLRAEILCSLFCISGQLPFSVVFDATRQAFSTWIETKNSQVIRILFGHAGTCKYLGEAKGHSEVQCTSKCKQIFVEIFSVLHSVLANTKKKKNL